MLGTTFAAIVFCVRFGSGLHSHPPQAGLEQRRYDWEEAQNSYKTQKNFSANFFPYFWYQLSTFPIVPSFAIFGSKRRKNRLTKITGMGYVMNQSVSCGIRKFSDTHHALCIDLTRVLACKFIHKL